MPVFFAVFFIRFFIVETQFFRQRFIIDGITNGGLYQAGALFPCFINNVFIGYQNINFRLQIQITVEISQHGFVHAAVPVIFPFSAGALNGHVVSAQYHVLCGDSYRLTVFRRQDIIDGQHHHPGFSLGFHRQGEMNRHLVTVKVGIVGRTYQRMQRDRAALG